MVTIINALSLIFGLVAVIFGILPLFVKNSKFSYVSLSFALLTLYCRILEYDSRVGAGDWSALLDTSDFNVKISYAFMMVVLIVNLISYKIDKK